MCIKIDIVLSYDDDINFDYSKTRKLFYFQSAPKSTRHWDYKSNCRRILYGLGKTTFRPKTYKIQFIWTTHEPLWHSPKQRKSSPPLICLLEICGLVTLPALCFFSWLGLMPKKCNQHWRLRANYATDKFDKVLFTRFSTNIVFPNYHPAAAGDEHSSTSHPFLHSRLCCLIHMSLPCFSSLMLSRAAPTTSCTAAAATPWLIMIQLYTAQGILCLQSSRITF